MKTSYKRLLQITSILILLFIPWMRTWSCGPEYGAEDYRFVLFDPQLSREPGLRDLNYNYHLNALTDGDPQKKDYYRNCTEWQQQVGGKLTDIYNIQYAMTPDDFLYAYRHNKWEDLKGNSFIHGLLEPANKPLLDYMAFAKEVEFNQFGVDDPWEVGNVNGGQEQTKVLFQVGEQAFSKITNPFLKERYAFQLEKLMFYGGGDGWDAVTTFYDRHLKGHSTIVADWGMLYYASVQEDPLKKTRLLCETFERSEEKKAFIYNDLRRKDLETLLKRDPRIPIAWFIRGCKQPGRGLPIIQCLHEVAPQSKYLRMLVVREVNKVEDWVMNPVVLGFNSNVREMEFESKKPARDYTAPDTTYEYYAAKNRLKDMVYMRTVRSYLESIQSPSDSNHVLYGLAVAHLYNMDGDYAKAMACLHKLDTRNNALYRRQWITEQMVAAMHTTDVKSDSMKVVFGAQLNEMAKLGAKVSKPDYDLGEDAQDNGFSTLLLMLSRQYEKQQDMVTAGLLFQKANLLVNGYYGNGIEDDTTRLSYRKIAYFDQHATPEDIDRLLALKHAKQLTAFEKFITPKVWAPEDFYKDVKLSLLVRQQRFAEALAVAEQMDKNFWEDNYEYTTYLTRKYIGSPDLLVPGEKVKKQTYPIASKRAILKDIVLLSDSLKQAPQNARLYYRMGNALYNITYGGRCWMLGNYGKQSSYDGSYGYGMGWQEYDRSELNRKYQAAYYKCEAAMDMYQKALANGQGQKELCAKVLLMMSVCDGNRNAFAHEKKLHHGPIYNYNTEEPGGIFRSRYLDVLRKKYGNTAVYADSKMMCPDVN